MPTLVGACLEPTVAVACLGTLEVASLVEGRAAHLGAPVAECLEHSPTLAASSEAKALKAHKVASSGALGKARLQEDYLGNSQHQQVACLARVPVVASLVAKQVLEVSLGNLCSLLKVACLEVVALGVHLEQPPKCRILLIRKLN